MANAIITLKLMGESPDVDFAKIEEEALKIITEANDDKETKTEIQPVAFGLKALQIIFVMDEAKGGPDAIEAKLAEIEGIQSVECTDVRRALG